MVIDDPTTNYCRSVEDICIPMISRFDRLMFLFRDMNGKVIHLNGEFELQLTIEDVYDQVPSSIPPMNQFSMIEVFGNTTKKEVKLGNPLSFDQCYISSVSLYTDVVLHNVPTDQVVVINGGRRDESVISIPRGAYDIEAIIVMLNASDALFELVYSGENAFHVTVTNFYTIDFTNAPELQSILGFESSALIKGLDNPRRYFLSASCNQVVVTNGTTSYVLSMPTGYYTFSEFIEAVGVEMVKVLPLVSVTISEDHASFNITKNSVPPWYFDRVSFDTTIDGFGWTPWFKLSPSVQNLCIERPVETQFDPSGANAPDATNDQGLGGYAYLDARTFVEYDWQMLTTTTFFILKPQVTYTMTNTDGSLFDSGTFYVTEDTKTFQSMWMLMSSTLAQLNEKYQQKRNITSSHQEAIAWTLGMVGDIVTWTAKDYAPDLEFDMISENMNVSVDINADKRGGSIGPWYSKDGVINDGVFLDSTNLVLSYEGYEKTSSLTITRGYHSALDIAQIVANGFNAIDGNRVIVREVNAGKISITPQSSDDFSLLVISNDNSFFPMTPGTSR